MPPSSQDLPLFLKISYFRSNLNVHHFVFFVLTEENLMSYSADSLFVLMLEKTQALNVLNRFDSNDRAYREMQNYIKLIQKVINLKDAEAA